MTSRAIVRAVRDVASGVREILLAPEDGAGPYPTGSHLELHLLLHGSMQTRHYSLVGESPIDGCWRIAVKFEATGRGGSKYMWSLAPGDEVAFVGPISRFELSHDSSPKLLLAGGIGITPLLGMARVLSRQGRDFRLVYAARTREHLAYSDELMRACGSRVDFRCDEDGDTIDFKQEFVGLDAGAECYVCGPPAFLVAAREAWSESGRPLAQFVYETFGTAGARGTAPFTVHVPMLGRSITVTEDVTMLEALQNVGIKIMSDCRRGECGLCAVDILEAKGEIDHRDVFFSQREHEANARICTCVSRMVEGELVVDSSYRPDEPLRSGPEVRPIQSQSRSA